MSITRIILYILFISIPIVSQEIKNTDIDYFSSYLKNFDYQERKEMKINIENLFQLLKEDKVEVIDVRFPEEIESWNVNFIKSIPLNELPDRLNELNPDKIIVTVCPHYDRASLARHYLTLKGFRSKYLIEGLLGLSEYLRGDKARDFINSIKK